MRAPHSITKADRGGGVVNTDCDSIGETNYLQPVAGLQNNFVFHACILCINCD
jgi:hypothetical protein